MQKKAIIIGAGPAGLTTAWEFIKKGIKPIIIEANNQYVGGLSRTEIYKENYIDIGGHRFFSKSEDIMKWWADFMPPENETTTKPKMLVRQRLSRIFYLRNFFPYPVTLNWQTIKNLGLLKITKIGFSYLATNFSKKKENNLEDFFINRFGQELYQTFFKDYTEKVWGVPCDKIPAEWGAQRIKKLSLSKAFLNAFASLIRKKDINQKNTETSLIDRFLYPPHGPGEFWTLVADTIKKEGGEILMGHTVTEIILENKQVQKIIATNENNEKISFIGDYYFSSMPVKDLIKNLNESPEEVKNIAKNLQYRDFLTVGLLVANFSYKKQIILDNWIYIQESDVKVGRIQIFNNWSQKMVANENQTWIGLEYFVNENDELWNKTQEEMIEFAGKELEKLGLLKKEDILDATTVKVPKAYPAYFGAYNEFDKIKKFTDEISNLFLIGRNGMHRYNNMDHSMLSAITAVDCAISQKDKEKIWQVNTEQEYNEESDSENIFLKFIEKYKTELFVFALFSFSTFILNLFHEPWLDEAQAWNLATDNNLLQILKLMPYEGTPALWHILLHFLNKIGLGFQYLFIIHWLLSVVAIAFLLFSSPFPRWLKISLPFTYYLFFEYNVISRSYILSILFLFILAFLNKNKCQKLPLYLFFLFLLSQTNFHAFLLSLVIGGFLLFEAVENKKKGVIFATILALMMIVALTFFQVKPPKDLAQNLPWLRPTLLSTLNYSINNAFCPIPAWTASPWNSQIINNFLLSKNTENNPNIFSLSVYFIFSLILLSFSILFFLKNKKLLLLYTIGLLLLESIFYLIHPGAIRHHGLIFIYFLYCLWLNYDEKNIIENKNYLNLILSIFIIFQLTATLLISLNEIKFNFSSEKITTQYLKESNYLEDGYLLIPFHVNTNPAISALITKKLYCLEYDTYCNFIVWNKTYEESLSWYADDLVQKIDIISQKNKDKKIILLLYKKINDVEFVQKFKLEKSYEKNLFAEGNIYIYRYIYENK